MTSRSRSKAKRLAILTMRAAPLLLACILLRPRSPLERAVHVPVMPPKSPTDTPDASGWMPPDRLLGFQQGAQDQASQDGYPYLLDLRTVQSKRLDALLHQIQAHHAKKPSEAPHAVSPDGKWLLWGSNGLKGPAEFHIAALDGSAFLTRHNLPRHEGCSLAWQEDSQAWILLYPADQPSEDLERAEIYPLDSHLPPRVVSLQNLHIRGSLVGTLAGRPVFYDWSSKRLTLFSLAAPAQTLRTYDLSRIASQPDQSVRDVLPSPDGKRLAWVVERSRKSLLALLDPDDQPSGPPDPPDIRLLVSDIDGRRVRLLGHFDARMTAEVLDSVFWHQETDFGLYAWSPDSRRLLFARSNTLWWVPIDD